MGYRSDVGLVIKRHDDGKITVQELLAMAKLKDIDPLKEWEGSEILEWNDNQFVFRAESVKWYEDYTAVRMIEEFMQLALETGEFSYGFVRVGEEHDDNEVKMEGKAPPYDLIGLSRQVVMDT